MSERLVVLEVNLEGNWGLADDAEKYGDVLPLADFEDKESLVYSTPGEIFHLQEKKTENPKRHEPPKTPRNRRLYGMAINIAAANRAEGASKITPVPEAFGTVVAAKEAMGDRRDRAKRLGREACYICPLSAECGINDGVLRGILKNNPKKSKSFRESLEKLEGDVLCEKLLQLKK